VPDSRGTQAAASVGASALVTGMERVRRTYRNLVKLSIADGKLDEKENQFLVEWGRSKGLPDEAIVELFDEAKRQTEDGLQATEFDDIYPLIALAMIDGYLSREELESIHGFGQRLGMNRTQVNAVIGRVQKGEYGATATA